MATQTTPSSSLTRNRIIVGSIAGFAAAYCAYLVYKNHNSSSPTGVGIHRSNAVYRPRRPQRSQRQRETPPADGAPSTTNGENNIPNFNAFPSYGRWDFINEDGQSAHIELNPHNLPTLESLQSEHRLSELQAQETLEAIQREFVTRFVLVHFSRDRDRGHARSPVAWGAAAQFLGELGIPLPAIEGAIQHFRRSLEAQLEDENALSLEQQLEQAGLADDAETILGTEDAVAQFHSRFNGGGLNLKQLLYHVAESQARQEVLHRGFRCDSCNTTPIRGIRWKCSNCVDIDLCNDCHATCTHNRSHIFYEIRVPTYAMSNIHPVQEPSYLGRPHLMPQTLPPDVCKHLVDKSGYEKAEIEGLYDQFTCIASTPMVQRRDKIGRAIDRDTFQKALHPLSSSSQLRPNLIFDRLFALFDTGSDGLVDFEEFVMGVVFIRTRSKSKNRRRKIFDAYDVDGDGFVNRKDFLRMFRAFFVIQKDISQDLLAPHEIENGLRDAASIVASSQPLSSAFTESRIPRAESTLPRNKIKDEFGEYRNQSRQRIVKASTPDRAKRSEIVGHSWESQAQFPFDHNSGEPLSVRDFLFLAPRDHQGQPDHRLARDQRVHFTYDGEPVANARKAAWKERWRRRRFYTDEEEGVRACGAKHVSKDEEQTKSEEQPNTEAQPNDEVLHSLEVDANLDANESLDTVSQRSPSRRQVRQIGGYQIPKPECDLGRDVMFQVMEDALNELLDPLFKQKESLAMEVSSTRKEREKWKKEVEAFMEKERKKKDEDDWIARDPLMATAMAAAADEAAQLEAAEKAMVTNGEAMGPNGEASRLNGEAMRPNGEASRPNGESSRFNTETSVPIDEVAIADGVATRLVPIAEAVSSVETQVNEQSLDELLDTTGYAARVDTSANTASTNSASTSSQPLDLATAITADDGSGTEVMDAQTLRVVPRVSSMFVPSPGGSVRFRELISTSQMVAPIQPDLPANFDPTMPQFRPNSDKELSLESPASDVTVDPMRPKIHEPFDIRSIPKDADKTGHREKFEAEIVRQFEQMFLGWNRDKDGIVVNGATKPRGRSGTIDLEQAPDDLRLARLAELHEAYLEIQSRKGPGKLSFEEFDTFLNNVKGNDFAFLENWLELCYF